ncbi:MAG: alanine--tRNA ligase [Candidatus Latescibacteria bacterium]|nr:alanine--tRNA ligase [Candidatus Latescibacterota bacterium]
MTSQDIRQSFLDFFAARGHTIVPSSSVIPWDDPTLLFSNAGMNQFKDVFLGTGTRSYRRAVDSQKCIRAGGKHNDLEDVGRDTYHNTFFEMLGNWSFGDYYKREAIAWAWELLTEEWKLPKEVLWATVFLEDDEAAGLWGECTDIDRGHILRFGEKDNFWEMGETGPCGPCSEISIDLGPDRCGQRGVPGHQCGVNAGCGRYMEIWNLVFIQYNRDETGALHPLPAKHVDTGMGFERMVALLQGVESNYDTDLFVSLLDRIAELTGQPDDETHAAAFRVIADHVRALTFAIADGGLPSNEGRGYVLRRILRRAARFGRTLDQHEPFIYRLVPTVVDIMGGAYPEVRAEHERVALVIKAEEEGFGRTLDRGLELFEAVAEQAGREGRREIAGAEAFKLYDTFGFPVDLIQLIAAERGLIVDLAGFEREMERQRARSRAGINEAARTFLDAQDRSDKFATEHGAIPVAHSKFLGYDTLKVCDVQVVAVFDSSVLLNQTPFYAESGGQVGDTGVLIMESGEEYRIIDTIRHGTAIIHRCDPADTRLLPPLTKVAARVDAARRRAIMRNHTATHLLHAALRAVLGTHVHQTGSLVAPDRLRFDFSHFSSVDPRELDEIERMVNEWVWENLPVESFETGFDDAKRMGAMALFEEKYGDRVRVVRVGDVSLELCGGTHLRATGEIGCFRLVRESASAAGVRRIEALTGEAAYQAIKQETRTLQEMAALLKTEPGDVVRRAEGLTARIRELEREIKRLRNESAKNWLDEMLADATQVDGVTVAAARVESPDVESLRTMADAVRSRLPGAAIGALFAVIADRPVCITVATDSAISAARLAAGPIAQDIAKIIGGGGGGKPHMAQAGGKEAAKLDEAIKQVPVIVRARLQNG